MSKRGYTLQFKNGEVAIRNVTGFGPNCAEATKQIEKFLGGAKEETREYTDEYEDGEDTDLYQEA